MHEARQSGARPLIGYCPISSVAESDENHARGFAIQAEAPAARVVGFASFGRSRLALRARGLSLKSEIGAPTLWWSLTDYSGSWVKSSAMGVPGTVSWEAGCHSRKVPE